MLNWIKNLSRRQTIRPVSKPAARLGLESLSERNLPSGVTLSGVGELHIEGSAGNDHAVVSRVNNKIEVNFDGQVSSYDAARVHHISFSGRAGNDSFVNRTAIRSSATGDSGNDVLIGGSSRDLLFGGAGSDVLSGGVGNDHLDGGQGRDYLDGGSGYDDGVGEITDTRVGFEIFHRDDLNGHKGLDG